MTAKVALTWRRGAVLVAALLLAYGVGAYVVMPAAWERYARRHPSVDDIPGITTTGADTVLRRPYDDAPLSNLYLWGRKQDLAFEQPVWVGFSITTGQITHHIAPDMDAEQDTLFRDLEGTGDLSQVVIVNGFHTIRQRRNGGGNPWHTDGRLFVGVIAAEP